jgi:hypothetical protein
MAFSSKQVTVDTSRDKIVDGDDGANALVRNTDATDSVFVGGSGVTAATGYELLPGAGVTVTLGNRADDLYGITASGTARVDVLVEN